MPPVMGCESRHMYNVIIGNTNAKLTNLRNGSSFIRSVLCVYNYLNNIVLYSTNTYLLLVQRFQTYFRKVYRHKISVL